MTSLRPVQRGPTTNGDYLDQPASMRLALDHCSPRSAVHHRRLALRTLAAVAIDIA